MDVYKTTLPGVHIFAPAVYCDKRGFFFEMHRASDMPDVKFVQDNFSFSEGGVLRGLHYQEPNGQGKLVQVLRGSIFDVAVDIRRGSPTFGKWFGTNLTDVNHRQLYIPPGFAHGFLAECNSYVVYKCTEYHDVESERSIAWNDPTIGIDWPHSGKSPVISDKDANAPLLLNATKLPEY